MRLLVHSYALEALKPWDGLEVGWLLLGTWIRNSIVITYCIDAGPKAVRKTNSIEFDNEYLTQQAAKFELLGEPVGVAHTHPLGNPFPSDDDYRADMPWIKKLKLKAGVFAIVTSTPHWYLLQEVVANYEPVTAEVVWTPKSLLNLC